MKKRLSAFLCAAFGLILFANVARAADTTPPTTNVNGLSGNPVLRGTVGIGCYAKDDVKVTKGEIYIDSILKATVAPVSFSTFSFTWDTGSAAAGNHAIYCKAYDAAGNVGTSAAKTVIVDKTPDTTAPVVKVGKPQSGETITGNYTYTASATDDYGAISNITIYIDGKALVSCPNIAIGTACQRGIAGPVYANGTHTIYAIATDTAGNIGTSVTNTFTIYNEKPTVTIISPANNGTMSGIYEISVSAKSTSSMYRITFYINGMPYNYVVPAGDAGPYKLSFDTRTKENGATIEIKVEAVDNNGGITVTPVIKATVYNDVSNWEVKVASPEDGVTVSGNVDIKTFATNSVSTQIFIDGNQVFAQSCASCSFRWNSASIYDGAHTMYTNATWGANVYTSPVIAFATNNGKPDPGDIVKPTVSLTAPTANYTFTTPGGGLRAAASDNTGIFKVEFYDGAKLLGTDTTYPYYYKWEYTSADNGPHSITAKAYDMKGNVGVSSALPVAVKVSGGTDITKPTVSLTAPTATNCTSAQIVAISASANDNIGVSKVEFYDGTSLLGTATIAPYSYNWSITAANNGTHSLTAKAYDAAGNSAVSTAVSLTVNIVTSDTTNPTVSITAPTPTTYSGAQVVAIEAAASDNIGVSKVEFYDGATLLCADTTLPYSYSWAITAANNGAHSLTAKTYDAAGNSTVSTAVLVTVNIAITDTTKPTVSITAPTANSAVSGVTAINAVATDNIGVSKVEFYIDGTLKATDTTSLYSYSWNTTAATNGIHSIYAKAYDAAGNVAASATVSVTVNNTVAGVGTPVIAITAPGNNTTVGGTVSIGGTATDDKGVTKVELYIDGNIKTTIVKPVYTLWKIYYSWNTSGLAKGFHTITAKAYDADGNIGVSAPVSVTVR